MYKNEEVKPYFGTGIKESELEYIGHGKINRVITYAIQKKGEDIYLLIDLSRDVNGYIVPRFYIKYCTYDEYLDIPKEKIAIHAYNFFMSIYR